MSLFNWEYHIKTLIIRLTSFLSKLIKVFVLFSMIIHQMDWICCFQIAGLKIQKIGLLLTMSSSFWLNTCPEVVKLLKVLCKFEKKKTSCMICWNIYKFKGVIHFQYLNKYSVLKYFVYIIFFFFFQENFVCKN